MVNKKDLSFFIIVLAALFTIGLGMIYSSSYIYAKEEFGSSTYFLFKQLIFLMTGIFFIFFLSKTKFTFWFRYAYFFHFIATLVLGLCFVPGFALQIKGAIRWLKFGGFTIQPGEFIKYSVLLCSLNYFQHFNQWGLKERVRYMCMIFFPMILLLLQPDFGMFFLCCMNIMLACFISDFPRRWFYSALLSLSFMLVGLIMIAPYRMKRLMSYLDPWSDPMGSGFQIIQSFLAFALGGVFGTGVGKSREKLFYLPEAHNDFIFSVIGEELGLLGASCLIALFMLFAYKGISLALQVKDRTKSFFGILAITSISFQATINMAVVIGLLPTKGLNLPFISYGGSSLLANALLLGLFFSVICKDENSTQESSPEY